VKKMRLKTEHSNENFVQETHWEKAAKTHMGKYLTQQETSFIFKALDFSRENMVVMDVGAEAGRVSLVALNAKATVVSIDIDRLSLERLKQKTTQAHIILADARKLPFKDDLFDATFMIEVMDYVPELEIALKECNRTLKNEGLCILSFGNKSSVKAKIKGLRGKSYIHSYRNVKQGLFATGFVLKKQMGYNWLPFGRISENRFVPILAWFEWAFGLRKLARISPWVIINIVKQLKQ
jgi:ubiquinone/menaquinone biosynthesis C-methylase UbiE